MTSSTNSALSEAPARKPVKVCLQPDESVLNQLVALGYLAESNLSNLDAVTRGIIKLMNTGLIVSNTLWELFEELRQSNKELAQGAPDREVAVSVLTAFRRYLAGFDIVRAENLHAPLALLQADLEALDRGRIFPMVARAKARRPACQ